MPKEAEPNIGKEKRSNVLKIILIIMLAVVAFLLALIIAGFLWFWFTDPFNLKTAIFDKNQDAASAVQDYDHPLLSEDQENMLEQAGVDVSALPTDITPEMEACAREKLGNERVDQIIQGSPPNAMDILKAGSCF